MDFCHGSRGILLGPRTDSHHGLDRILDPLLYRGVHLVVVCRSFQFAYGLYRAHLLWPGRLHGHWGVYHWPAAEKKSLASPLPWGSSLPRWRSALAALIIGYFCIRLSHVYFAMLTLAFSQIVYFTAFKWYDFTGGDNGLIGIPVPAWVQDPTFTNYYRFVLVVCVIGIFILWRIVNSPLARR